MKKYRLNFYLLMMMLSTAMIFGQNATLTGTVKDSSNGNALVGANVFISGTSLGAAAIEDGIFTINNIKPGSYTVKVSYIGYKSKEIEIELTEAKKYEQDFFLEYTTIEGQTVVVMSQAKGQMDAINRQLLSLIHI